MKLPRTGDPHFRKIVWVVIQSLNINLAPKLVMYASKLCQKMMKLPRTGDLIPKYQFATKLQLFALKT